MSVTRNHAARAVLQHLRNGECAGKPAYQEALDMAIAALTREPAPATDCENIEPGLSAHGGGWQRCTDREPDDLGTWCDWCRHRGVVPVGASEEPPFPEPAPCPHRELMEEAREALVRSCAYVHENRSDIVTDTQELAQRIDAALASAQPCAAPGEPSQEDFDGMQRWLDDALRRCRDDDHKRLKYLHADVRILAAARRWVARAAPGEAGEWEEVARGTPRHDCVPPVEIENAMKAGVEHVVCRRRAPQQGDGR